MEAVNLFPISYINKPSNIITSSHADIQENPSASMNLRDEARLGSDPELSDGKHLSFKPFSNLRSHLAPSLTRLSIIGFGLLCGFGSIAAQPFSEANPLGKTGNESVKDKIETVVEKPETVYDSVAGGEYCKVCLQRGEEAAYHRILLPRS